VTNQIVLKRSLLSKYSYNILIILKIKIKKLIKIYFLKNEDFFFFLKKININLKKKKKIGGCRGDDLRATSKSYCGGPPPP
jgi:hypothetical protein